MTRDRRVAPAVAIMRSRRLDRLAIVCVLVASAAFVFRSQAVPLPLLRVGMEYEKPVVVLAPALIGVVLGSGMHSPLADLELTAARSMRLVRLVVVLALTLTATLLAVVPLVTGGQITEIGAALRNALGVLGLTLTTGSVVGYGLAWTIPLAFLGLSMVYGVDVGNDPHPWAWPLAPSDDLIAILVAGALLVLGGVLAALREQEPVTQRSG